jgi:hypothetical protein
MVSTKTPPEDQPMNKLSWQAQKAIRDADTWRHWIIDSADKFIIELKTLSQKKGMPPEDVTNISNVREQLVEFKKLLNPLEKSIHKATGRRIQRSRKRA